MIKRVPPGGQPQQPSEVPKAATPELVNSAAKTGIVFSSQGLPPTLPPGSSLVGRVSANPPPRK